MTVLDIVHSLVALACCGALFAFGVSRWPAEERQVAMYCWYAHAASAYAIMVVYVFYYGWGDMLHYFYYGRALAAYVEYDLLGHLPQLFDVLLQRESDIPMAMGGLGTSTGSMVAVGGIVSLLTSSGWAGSVIVSTLSAGGQACLWLGVRELVPPERQKHALWSVMMVPSVVFWSSSLLKEAFGLMGIGVAILGAVTLKKNVKSIRGILLLVLGVYVVGLFKSYILFPLTLSLGVYVYWSRAVSRGGVTLRPVVFVAGAGITIASVALLGLLFPRYSVENVAESIEQQQSASLTTDGGSDFREVSEDQAPRGAAGLVADAPFTISTALLRPFLFESTSPTMLVSAVEMTAILYFIVMAFVRNSWIELLRWLWRSPDIIAAVAFVLLFSSAVGLATTNLGTLSRYRLPMMPFYFYVVFSASALPSTLRDAQRRGAQARGLQGRDPSVEVT